MAEYTSFINELKDSNFGGFNAIEYADGGFEPYISFQALLKWVSEYPNLYSKGQEIVSIDYLSDKPFFTYSTSISCDLSKCYIRNRYLKTTQGTFLSSTAPPFKSVDTFKDPSYSSLNTTLKNEAGEIEDISMYPQVGNINYIYISVTFLTNLTLKESDNRDNKVSVATFLQKVCDGVNKSLGSINDFQVITDVDGIKETLTIVDYQQKRIKGLPDIKEKDSREITTIRAQGLGSMLTKIQAQSSITPEIASMIAIGAQAQSQPVGEEATSFSRLSRGLTDRVYPTKVQSITTEKALKREEKRKEAIEDKFKQSISAYSKFIKNQQPSPDDLFSPVQLKSTDKANLSNIATELYKSCLAMFTDTKQTSTAFIPVKLNLSMYGLGGLKIYQRFKLSDDVLPLSYKGEYEFITLGIDHTVDTSRWETNISAVISLKDEKIKKEGADEPFSIRLKEIDITELSTAESPRTRGAKPGIKCNTITKTVNSFDAVLRLVIDNLEGSYAKGGLSAGSANSGETLWGLDRKNHAITGNTSKFWAAVDKENKSKWNASSYPKPGDKPELYKLYVPILKQDYNSFKKGKNANIFKIIEGDGRLFFHMVYAVFNGAGWFNGFYKIIELAYKNGITSPEELLKLSVDERVSGARRAYTLGTGNRSLGQVSATLLANTGVDIEKLVGLAAECPIPDFA